MLLPGRDPTVIVLARRPPAVPVRLQRLAGGTRRQLVDHRAVPDARRDARANRAGLGLDIRDTERRRPAADAALAARPDLLPRCRELLEPTRVDRGRDSD